MIEFTHHIAIQTNDFEKTLDFYHRILGLKIVDGPKNFKARRICFLDTGNIQIELYSIKVSEGNALKYTSNRGGLDHVSFVVSDIYETISSIKSEGIKIIKEPFLPPTGKKNQSLVAFITGPDDQEIEIREKSKN